MSPKRTLWLSLAAVAALAALVSAAGLRPWAGSAKQAATVARPRPHPVEVRKPVAPRISTGQVDEKGELVSVGCATCHLSKPPDPLARLGKSLASFHQHLAGKHGDLSCTSCHNPGDGYATLRLADGTSVPHAEVMQLCAQCHGPQFRDYQRGAHGGMTGYWDLARGPRARNNCIDCHSPHAPKYPQVQPARGPADAAKGGRHE